MDFLIIIIAVCSVITMAMMFILFMRSKSGDNISTVRKLENFRKSVEAENRDITTRLTILDKQLEQTTRQIAEEFQRNRRDTVQLQHSLREETTNSLQHMAKQLNAMTRDNYERQERLTQTLSAALKEIREQNAEQSEKQNRVVESSISKMQESNEKKLDEMRATVDEKLNATLADRLDSSFKTVSDRLENVYKSLGEMKEISSGVTNNVSSLNRILTNVKARGTWAEVQLEGILDQTIPQMYDKNVSTGANSTERVEFAIRIPSGEESGQFIYLPVDSKFPMEDYIRLCDAADRADSVALSEARKALENRVRGEAKEIRKYINEPNTTPFAIMYLATEGLYAEIASSSSGILETIQSEYNVLIAGPTTITALLNSLSVGFKAVTINEKAKEVREVLSAAKTQYDKFTVLLEKAHSKVEEAGKALESAQHRNTMIHKKLRSVETVSLAQSNSLLELSGLEEEE